MSGAQGRFQSPDPGNAGADPSNPQTWNAYSYVGNNPLSYTDPSGASWVSDIFAGFAGLGAFLSSGNPWVGIEFGLQAAGFLDTFDSLAHGQIPGSNLFGLNLGSYGNPGFGGLQVGLPGGGGLNTGGAYGNGSAGPFVFDNSSEDQQGQYLNGRLLLPDGDVAIWGIGGGQGGAVLKAAGKRATHDMGCAGLGFAVSGAGATAVSASLPTITKPFSQGGTPKTSAASEAFRDWTKGARGGPRLPAFEGGPSLVDH